VYIPGVVSIIVGRGRVNVPRPTSHLRRGMLHRPLARTRPPSASLRARLRSPRDGVATAVRHCVFDDRRMALTRVYSILGQIHVRYLSRR
jgi:hypothetical protein